MCTRVLVRVIITQPTENFDGIHVLNLFLRYSKRYIYQQNEDSEESQLQESEGSDLENLTLICVQINVHIEKK